MLAGLQAGGLRATFSGVPDAAFSKLDLRLMGGRTGFLVNAEPLCQAAPLAIVSSTGQNGRRSTQRVKIAAACQ